MINRLILSEQVKEELLNDILMGKYQPGDRLVESQIAKEMGISQSPVREALRDLVAMRFVEVVPYKGARVRMIDPATSWREIYPVRARWKSWRGSWQRQTAEGQRERTRERSWTRCHAGKAQRCLNELTTIDAQFPQGDRRGGGNRHSCRYLGIPCASRAGPSSRR
jgi:DNA-binding transcriptional MocR family regulator